MRILQALSMADLQKFAFLLTQLEAHGVQTLAAGRERVEDTLRREHRLKQRVASSRVRKNRPMAARIEEKCPDCGSGLGPLFIDSDGTIGGVACKQCRYSRLEEQ